MRRGIVTFLLVVVDWAWDGTRQKAPQSMWKQLFLSYNWRMCVSGREVSWSSGDGTLRVSKDDKLRRCQKSRIWFSGFQMAQNTDERCCGKRMRMLSRGDSRIVAKEQIDFEWLIVFRPRWRTSCTETMAPGKGTNKGAAEDIGRDSQFVGMRR